MDATVSRTAALSESGVSIWLDDLSREHITSGELQRLIADRNVVGITTNPTIFASALTGSTAYDNQIASLAAAGVDAHDAIVEITTHDVAQACDVLRPVFEATDGRDGRVSIEVSPAVAHDVPGTLAEARLLLAKVNRPNAHIKIPATREGLEAIAAATALGLSVNVTLIFSLDRYRGVIDAYLSGLEAAHAAGIDVHGIRSVASFFVSRVDTEVDRRLEQIGTTEALALRSRLGVANARLAYEIFTEQFATTRARRLLELGANLQRPLWASTGVKNPALSDTLYVVELVAPHVVTTMPGQTLEALFDHGEVRGNTIEGSLDESRQVFDAIAAVGISYDDVTDLLEREGIEKFTQSWNGLSAGVAASLRSLSR